MIEISRRSATGSDSERVEVREGWPSRERARERWPEESAIDPGMR